MMLCSYSWFVKGMVLLKVVYPLKIYQHTKCHGPTLTGEFCTHLGSSNVRPFFNG
jgi:hypothetical protein